MIDVPFDLLQNKYQRKTRFILHVDLHVQWKYILKIKFHFLLSILLDQKFNHCLVNDNDSNKYVQILYATFVVRFYRAIKLQVEI